MMKIDAVGVTSSDLKKTVAFYTLLGFEFGEVKEGEDHVEPKASNGSPRLMIDSKELITDLIGEKPKPGNASTFAIGYDLAQEVDEVARKVKEAGFVLIKEPWDAFWGQRYAVVQDPDGYKVDLYAGL